MILLLRIEINIISISIITLLLLNTRRSVSMLLDQRIFQIILYSSLVSSILDLLTWLVDGQNFKGAHTVGVLTNLIYFVTCVEIPYLWTLYVEFRLTDDELSLRKKARLFLPPLFIFLVVLFSSPFTGWIFYIDAHNIYHRGSLYFIQILVSLFYLVYPSIRALKMGLKTKIDYDRKAFMTIASFTVYPILATTIQILIYGLPVVNFATVLSELIIFINVQNQQISLDALTKINNRGQFNRYLDIKIKNVRKENTLYMLLLDIDHFKSINDSWGHKMGDQALVDMADILKKICNKYQAFVARYGGDEFTIILECKSDGTVQRAVAAIEAEI